MQNFRFLGHLEVPEHFVPATHPHTHILFYICTSRVPVLRTGKDDVPFGLPLDMDANGKMVFLIPVPENNYFSDPENNYCSDPDFQFPISRFPIPNFVVKKFQELANCS